MAIDLSEFNSKGIEVTTNDKPKSVNKIFAEKVVELRKHKCYIGINTTRQIDDTIQIGKSTYFRNPIMSESKANPNLEDKPKQIRLMTLSDGAYANYFISRINMHLVSLLSSGDAYSYNEIIKKVRIITGALTPLETTTLKQYLKNNAKCNEHEGTEYYYMVVK